MKSIQQLQANYREAAIAHGQALPLGDYKRTNNYYAKLRKIYQLVKDSTPLAEDFFTPLLVDSNDYVSTWAASHCLSLGIYVKKSENVLLSVSRKKSSRFLASDAEGILQRWREHDMPNYG